MLSCHDGDARGKSLLRETARLFPAHGLGSSYASALLQVRRAVRSGARRDRTRRTIGSDRRVQSFRVLEQPRNDDRRRPIGDLSAF
jgi:hypothetical protein